jgi:hypothetical protein
MRRQPLAIDHVHGGKETMPASADKTGIEGATIRAITWRILPFQMVCYFIAFVDRVDAGFGALQVNQAIGLPQHSAQVAGYSTSRYVIFDVQQRRHRQGRRANLDAWIRSPSNDLN